MSKINSLKPRFKSVLGAMLIPVLLLSACGKSDQIDCQVQLDKKSFKEVSESGSCSDYERASAYLARAGFLFENFLAADASKNFRHALGIPDSATDYSTWEGKTFYETAAQLSGDATGDKYEGKTRSTELIEIHYFNSLAQLMAPVYIALDSDANGTISDSEKNSFSKLNSGSNLGINDIAVTDYLMFGNYLLDLKKGTCYADSKKEGIYFSNGGSGSDLATCGFLTSTELATANAGGTVTKSGTCAVVAEVKSLQNMFSEVIPAGSGNVAGLISGIVNSTSAIDRDLAALNLPSDSDLRQSLKDFNTQMDNGGSCSGNTSVTEIDQILTLAAISQSTVLTDYSNVNQLRLSSLKTASDNAAPAPGTSIVVGTGKIVISCDNSSDLDVRLIFSQPPNNSFFAYYKPDATADQNNSGIYTTFTSLNNIRRDADKKLVPDTANDQKVSFKELLCAQ